MQIEHPETRRILDDYEFTFVSGLSRTYTLDKAAGDEVEYVGTTAVILHIVAKPSVADPDILLPPEEVTLFTKHLAFIQHRVREVVDLNPDQLFEWKKTIQEIGKTKH